MKMKNENWRQELVDSINEKAQEYKDVTINYRSPTMEMMCAVVSECDAMREELEGIGLSDAQVSIVELAFKRGVAVGAHQANHIKYMNAPVDFYINKALQETNHEDD